MSKDRSVCNILYSHLKVEPSIYFPYRSSRQAKPYKHKKCFQVHKYHILELTLSFELHVKEMNLLYFLFFEQLNIMQFNCNRVQLIVQIHSILGIFIVN